MALLQAPIAVGTTDTTILAEGTARTNVLVRLVNKATTGGKTWCIVYYSNDTVSAAGEEVIAVDMDASSDVTKLIPNIESTHNLVAKAEAATTIVATVYGT